MYLYMFNISGTFGFLEGGVCWREASAGGRVRELFGRMDIFRVEGYLEGDGEDVVKRVPVVGWLALNGMSLYK